MISHATLIMLTVFLAVAAPCVYIYAKRDNHLHMKPKAGEITMVALFSMLGCVALTFGLTSLMGMGTDIGDFRSGGASMQTKRTTKVKDKFSTELVSGQEVTEELGLFGSRRP